jgi:hypothetical protein
MQQGGTRTPYNIPGLRMQQDGGNALANEALHLFQVAPAVGAASASLALGLQLDPIWDVWHGPLVRDGPAGVDRAVTSAKQVPSAAVCSRHRGLGQMRSQQYPQYHPLHPRGCAQPPRSNGHFTPHRSSQCLARSSGVSVAAL